MNAKATDNLETWNITKTFLENPNETYLFLQMESEYTKYGYTIIKLPYGENIYLLYATSWHDSVLCPGIDMKYAGFYSRQHKQSYHIREPLDRFFEFDGVKIYESQLKDMVKKAVQRTVAEYISGKAKEFSGLSLDDLNNDIIRDAEMAFSKKEITLDFAEKIVFNELFISEKAMIDYIDNPDNINNSESHLKRYFGDIINGHEEELARLWFAHCTSQKILDRLHAEYKDRHESISRREASHKFFENTILASSDTLQCTAYDEPRTFDWCEENCPKYSSCDTIAWAEDESKLLDGEAWECAKCGSIVNNSDELCWKCNAKEE